MDKKDLLADNFIELLNALGKNIPALLYHARVSNFNDVRTLMLYLKDEDSHLFGFSITYKDGLDNVVVTDYYGFEDYSKRYHSVSHSKVFKTELSKIIDSSSSDWFAVRRFLDSSVSAMRSFGAGSFLLEY